MGEPVGRSTFPPPPVWFSLFTDESKAERDAGVSAAKALWTPPTPIAVPFTKFGMLQTGSHIKHELGAGIPQLYNDTPPINFSAELRKLNRLALVRYTELLAALTGSAPAAAATATASGSASAAGPSGAALELINGLEHVFFNITHLLNLLRPHQARQTLITVLEKQIRARHEKAEYLESCVSDAERLLSSHGVQFAADDLTTVLPPHLASLQAAANATASTAAAAAAAAAAKPTTPPPPVLSADELSLKSLLDAIPVQ